MKRTLIAALSALFVLALAIPAFAYTGFVGKGEVQTALGLNNNQLQAQADSLQFAAVTVSETTWDCLNTNNERIQDRQRTTTTEGLVSHTERVRNQITGFNLTGFTGDTTVTTEGPAVGSCPSGPWTFVEGSTQTHPGDPVLYVNGVALQ